MIDVSDTYYFMVRTAAQLSVSRYTHRAFMLTISFALSIEVVHVNEGFHRQLQAQSEQSGPRSALPSLRRFIGLT